MNQLPDTVVLCLMYTGKQDTGGDEKRICSVASENEFESLLDSVAKCKRVGMLTIRKSL